MKSFTTLKSVVAFLDQSNVDTDAIIPKQYLTSIKKTGFGEHLFEQWRYVQEAGERKPNPSFILNKPSYKTARILLARENFGCGSSREHAAWALAQYGIRAIVAVSFADIFFSNAINNGILPIVLTSNVVDDLFLRSKQCVLEACVNLTDQSITLSDKTVVPFNVESKYREKLLNGWDDIDLTLKKQENIRLYEQKQQQQTPWLFNDI